MSQYKDIANYLGSAEEERCEVPKVTVSMKPDLSVEENVPCSTRNRKPQIKRRKKVRKGDVILSGGITAAVKLNFGDVVSGKLDGFDEVSFTVTN